MICRRVAVSCPPEPIRRSSWPPLLSKPAPYRERLLSLRRFSRFQPSQGILRQIAGIRWPLSYGLSFADGWRSPAADNGQP
jgi:hypothetical protein